MRIRVVGLFTLLTVSCGPPPTSAARQPVAAAAGTSTGAMKTGVIGASGGALATDDGRFTLTVPAGAVSADTTFGIEPLTNTAPLGAGAAYRLTPEGTKFSTAATVSIQYTDADLGGTTSDALAIAYQSSDGFWHAMKTPTVDTAAKTVSVSTVHLSDWSMVFGWQLRPPVKTVPTFGTAALSLAYCQPDTFTDAEGDTLSGLVPNCGGMDPELPPLLNGASWQVNGGSGSLGDGFVQGMGATATYTAPGAPPMQNPVAVSVTFNPQGHAKLIAVSSITVGAGAWQGTVSWTMTGTTNTMMMTGSGNESSTTTVMGMESGTGSVTVTSADPTFDPSLTAWTVDTLNASYQVTHDDLTVGKSGSPCNHIVTNSVHIAASGSWMLADATGPTFSNVPASGDPAGTYHFNLSLGLPNAPGQTTTMSNEMLSGDCTGITPFSPTNQTTATTQGPPHVSLTFDAAVSPNDADAISGSTTLMDPAMRSYAVMWSLARQ